MTAEQKERMKYEVEVQKARELKRIADALEIMSGLKCSREVRGPDVEYNEPVYPDDIASIRADLIRINEKFREANACNNRLKDE